MKELDRPELNTQNRHMTYQTHEQKHGSAEQNRTEQSNTAQNKTEQNRTEQNRATQHRSTRTEQN